MPKILEIKIPLGFSLRVAKWAWHGRAAATDLDTSATGGWRSEPIVVRTRHVCKHRDWGSSSGSRYPSGAMSILFSATGRQRKKKKKKWGTGTQVQKLGMGFETRK